VIEDKMTARILGLLFILLPAIVVVSTLVMTKPEARTGRLVAVLVVPSLPFALFGGYLLRRASSLPEDDDES